jgi:hypothetical protein
MSFVPITIGKQVWYDTQRWVFIKRDKLFFTMESLILAQDER